jgi:hypothetical protein
MSTPAAQAAADAAAAAAAGGGGSAPAAGATPAVPGAGAGGAPPAANPPKFWESWATPELKETREWVANKNYGDIQTLAKSAHQFERDAAALRAGKGYPVATTKPDGTVVPPDPQALRAWDIATGVPESADKYDLPVPADNPYPQFKTFMSEELHKAHVPAGMATEVARGYERAVQRMEAEIRAQEDATSQQGLAAVKAEWGAQYQERMALADRARAWIAKEAGGLNDTQMRVLESVMTTPKFLGMLYKIGAGNSEARFAGGDDAGGFAGGATEAQARLAELQANRAAGKISNFEWAKLKPELDSLTEKIAGGMAPQGGMQ